MYLDIDFDADIETTDACKTEIYIDFDSKVEISKLYLDLVKEQVKRESGHYAV